MSEVEEVVLSHKQKRKAAKQQDKPVVVTAPELERGRSPFGVWIGNLNYKTHALPL
jgi:hypothetical protein